MKAPVCADALIVINDAQTFLVVFQMVDKGGCGQRLFQIVQTPAFVDLIEIGRLALGPLPNFKVTLGFEKAQDIIALLHCFFQICRSAFADGKLIVVPNQPMQPLQCPKQDTFFFVPHLVNEKRIIHPANGLFLSGEQQLAAIETVRLVMICSIRRATLVVA